MKHLITATASLLVLLAFLVQFTHSQMLHGRLLAADRQVNTFREEVKQEGCISAERETQLKEELAKTLGCSPKEVIVTAEDRVPVFRGEQVRYEIEAPVNRVVALAEFWNIEEMKNRFIYRVKGAATSEYTGRPL